MYGAACAFCFMSLATFAFAEEPDAKQILDKVAAQYAAMQTYQAEGTVVADMENNGAKARLETTFSMKLKKPDLYLITWVQKVVGMSGAEQPGAVWNAGNQPYLYMGVMKAYSKLKGDDMALATATGISAGAAHTVPSLFFSALAPKRSTPLGLQDPKIEKNETLDGEECYVISGSSAGSKRITLWVSAKSYFIKQYARSMELTEAAKNIPEMTDEQLDATVKATGGEPTPEARQKLRDAMNRARETMKNVKITGVSTERHVTFATPDFKAGDFEFKPPEGTRLVDSLFGAVKFPDPDKEDVTNTLPVKMSEGIAGVGLIRIALRVYAAAHGGEYPTLVGIKGDALCAALGIGAQDLNGKDFAVADYEVNSTPAAYTIKATLGAETYIINQKGVESGTYRTAP